jgi:hypothetical protein
MARHSGHGFDALGAGFSFHNKERIDKIIGGEPIFTHQPARELVTAHAAHPPLGKTAQGLHYQSPEK